MGFYGHSPYFVSSCNGSLSAGSNMYGNINVCCHQGDLRSVSFNNISQKLFFGLSPDSVNNSHELVPYSCGYFFH